MKSVYLAILVFAGVIPSGCKSGEASHREMLAILRAEEKRYHQADNLYAPDAHLRHSDSLIKVAHGYQDVIRLSADKARALIALGREDEAIAVLQPQLKLIEEKNIRGMDKMKALLGLAYFRNGERQNCIANHTGETCIFPIRGTGIHKFPDGSRNAVRVYEELLKDNPDNLEYRWLLNIAAMTLDEYPDALPASLLIPGLNPTSSSEETAAIKPFEDMASALGLDVNNMAGGCIIDDFNNDGYLDIVTSAWGLDEPMRFFENNKDGSFSDKSESSKLNQLTGGLNLMQVDYNNDGFKDIFVLRGAWLRGNYGTQPNSLLRNNGDGTFTDVTKETGMLSFHPSQTATWSDFNNDGWLDVFIGNETWEGNSTSGLHPAELYINNGGNSFTEVAKQAQCDILGFVKGVTSGDYNNDGWQDIFATSLSGRVFLLRNKGTGDMVPAFEDVTEEAGITLEKARTFPTWFWDYNNDGWLDLFLGDFTNDLPIAAYSAAEALDIPLGTPGAPILFRNNRDGTFSNVSEDVGLTGKAFAMGANFGDIDNDGYLDFYLGTGNPELESVVPNKLFHNRQGEKFSDVTTAARVGHLQKGHAISFADLDNDGDQDIYIEMGGAYKGDAFHSAFYVNPGQDTRNNWISLELVGTKANRNGVGARIKITVREDDEVRHIYRDVNSGGSFGASPLRKEIGIGKASLIDEIEVQWHPGGKQVFRQVMPNRFLRIRENDDTVEEIELKKLHFKKDINPGHHHHSMWQGKKHWSSHSDLSCNLVFWLRKDGEDYPIKSGVHLLSLWLPKRDV